jgi:hypothetical protein
MSIGEAYPPDFPIKCSALSYVLHFQPISLSLLDTLQYLMAGHSSRAVAPFKAWNVFAFLDAGIMGSNPTPGMDVWRV